MDANLPLILYTKQVIKAAVLEAVSKQLKAAL